MYSFQLNAVSVEGLNSSLCRGSKVTLLSFPFRILKFRQHFPLVASWVWPVRIQTRLLLRSSFSGMTHHGGYGIKIIIIIFVQEILVVVHHSASLTNSFHFCSSRLRWYSDPVKFSSLELSLLGNVLSLCCSKCCCDENITLRVFKYTF